ncbi:hypothetical protein BCON_0068g00380 [Botryotinia convoluta]|uniref:Uncharacterized protein n=1 Tax=Botryotinia convoluta TaxID=54673 RepID=A0A4Z1IKI4_9HELO|nr:hypothetical protein BCON_0068g00380 [Botryotinia convoluta]
MSSSKAKITEAKIATLEKHDSVKIYKTHCKNVEELKTVSEVVKYREAAATYKATIDDKEVEKFIKLRGPDASDSKLKKMKEIKVVAKFAEAEKLMNKLAEKTSVTRYLWAESAMKKMQKENLEVVQYNMAIKSLDNNKEKNKANISPPQPSGSSTGSTQNPPNAGDGNGTQNRPLVRKDPNKLNYRKGPWIKERAEAYLPMQASPPALDDPNNTRRDRSKERSGDRSNPKTGPKPAASASRNVEPKINSGKVRRGSYHTEKEREFMS